MKNLIFKGASVALVTPFSCGEIDYSALGALIEHQIKGGVDAIVIGGTTGECATLSEEEKYCLYTYAKAKVAGRVKLVLGAGSTDTRKCCDMAKRCEQIGCDGLLVVTPYYNKGTERGVTEHYKEISRSTSLPIILYNVPSRTGVNLTRKQLDELAKEENIVAIKEAADSADRLVMISEYGDELYLYAGNDSQIYTTLALGGMGVVSVLSNLYPRYVSTLCESFFGGDHATALKMQHRAMPLISALFYETNPAPIKWLLSEHGLCKSELRLPLYPPENATRVALSSAESAFLYIENS